ncbi:hypothetical protein RF679_00325 [Undibacterium cyanobacteriorum]|uniref:Uncharacterized protein n=1 Tax=Undibacterium cyanobacteriorum TaxID=3073561 RepID=A0ABY9RJ81_9BURK|nr:hypothetical protein [Undibacterium sp. 20NA77.5]WMW80739.1 hypothetical protein RF679_00325 [Undibacterium sp. 20NA77.5]
MDAAFRARYQILQPIYGEFEGGDRIEFTAYDHYGTPKFGQHQQVMLFVTKIEGQWYHVKYQYFPVDPTKDGDWAFCGNPYGKSKGAASLHSLPPAALQAIDYVPELTFDLKKISEESESSIDDVARRFPSPLYATTGHNAVCKMGVRAQDLLELMKQTVLKQRGFF